MKSETVDGATFETWEVAEVAAAAARGEVVLIDVRTIQEYAFEHIGGALLLPMPFFEARIDRIAHMAGGFAAWKAAKLPYVGTNMATGAPQTVNP